MAQTQIESAYPSASPSLFSRALTHNYIGQSPRPRRLRFQNGSFLAELDYLLGGRGRKHVHDAGDDLNLYQVGEQVAHRLVTTFLTDPNGQRPVYGGTRKFQNDPHWRDLLLFYEYFHGDNGAGLGASHQTGWTGACEREQVGRLVVRNCVGCSHISDRLLSLRTCGVRTRDS